MFFSGSVSFNGMHSALELVDMGHFRRIDFFFRKMLPQKSCEMENK